MLSAEVTASFTLAQPWSLPHLRCPRMPSLPCTAFWLGGIRQASLAYMAWTAARLPTLYSFSQVMTRPAMSDLSAAAAGAATRIVLSIKTNAQQTIFFMGISPLIEYAGGYYTHGLDKAKERSPLCDREETLTID